MMTPQEHFEAARDYAIETILSENKLLKNNASELTRENAGLKAQIEKLKCCENCKHHCFWGNELNCRTLSYDEELKCIKTKEHWEIIADD